MPRARAATNARPVVALHPAAAARRAWPHAACACFLLLALAWPAAARAQAPADRAAELAERVAALVNDYRVQQQLGALRAAQALDQLADEHSRQMAATGRISHEGFRGRFERAASTLCVENVAAGFDSAEALIEGWQRSPEHDRNLLEPRVARMGVAAAGRHLTLLACR
ncbi:MAG: CAP domain-containing protein [Burkholderiales bacterium]|nr:CAP domain-containing protein [Burkholderiales bacterium]